jgi:hypothetical protein
MSSKASAKTQPSEVALSSKSLAAPVSDVVNRSSSVAAAMPRKAAMPSASVRPGASVPDTVAAEYRLWRYSSGGELLSSKDTRLSSRIISVPPRLRTAMLPRSPGRERKSRVSWPITSCCLPSWMK